MLKKVLIMLIEDDVVSMNTSAKRKTMTKTLNICSKKLLLLENSTHIYHVPRLSQRRQGRPETGEAMDDGGGVVASRLTKEETTSTTMVNLTRR
jgi:hypothetical protein